jgi:hypothetical protein
VCWAVACEPPHPELMPTIGEMKQWMTSRDRAGIRMVYRGLPFTPPDRLLVGFAPSAQGGDQPRGRNLRLECLARLPAQKKAKQADPITEKPERSRPAGHSVDRKVEPRFK